MKEHKNEARLERKRRLAKALKANLVRRKGQRQKQEASNGPRDAGVRHDATQEGCPGGAIVLGTGDTGGKR
jgi:hypothetical protein